MAVQTNSTLSVLFGYLTWWLIPFDNASPTNTKNWGDRQDSYTQSGAFGSLLHEGYWQNNCCYGPPELQSCISSAITATVVYPTASWWNGTAPNLPEIPMMWPNSSGIQQIQRTWALGSLDGMLLRFYIKGFQFPTTVNRSTCQIVPIPNLHSPLIRQGVTVPLGEATT